MGGFPNRPDLAAFGPTLQDTTAVRDPTRHVGASLFNLMRHQLAGLGIVLPLAMLRFSAAPSPAVIARAEAWNPRALTSSPFTDPTLTRISTGNYEVVYPSPVTDDAGASVVLAFAYGLGTVVTPSQSTFRHVMVTPLTGNSAGVKVMVQDAAGSGVDGHDVAILIG